MVEEGGDEGGDEGGSDELYQLDETLEPLAPQLGELTKIARLQRLLQARDEGKFDFAQIKGDLFELCRGQVKGRTSDGEITLFKSAGTAIEDLATAIMLYQKAR